MSKLIYMDSTVRMMNQKIAKDLINEGIVKHIEGQAPYLLIENQEDNGSDK